MLSSLSVDGLSFSYDGKVMVLEGLDFSVTPGEIFCILGPSGCGKTTLVRLLAGLLKPSSGLIGEGFSGPKSFIFQEPRLLPQVTVLENLRFTCPESVADMEAVQEVLDSVGLGEYLHYFPDELSGGMQQRLSVARAFLQPADLLFLDEPFQSLDVKIKLSVMDGFKALWDQGANGASGTKGASGANDANGVNGVNGVNDEKTEKTVKTAILITHDVLDAALLADHILVLTEKPTHMRALIENPVPRDERVLGDSRVGALQQELYALLMT